MIKKINEIEAGMTIFDVHKLLGQPFKTLVEEDQPVMALYKQQKFFNRLLIIKVLFKEGLVYEVNQSVEKRLKIQNV